MHIQLKTGVQYLLVHKQNPKPEENRTEQEQMKSF